MAAWVLSLPLAGPGARAGEVTFNRDVAPIVHAHCAACHREGETAPFPLLTYDDVRKRAKQVAEVTAGRIMPPWKAEPQEGHPPFVGARRLSDGQIDVLRRWAERGSPEGDPADAPPPPRFTAGWRLGEPDVIVRMPDAYTVPAEGRDIYRSFIVPVRVPAGKYVRAVEYRPGNPKVVHHAVLSTMAEGEARKLQGAEPPGTGPGFATGLVAPGDRLPGSLGIWAPGKEPLALPDGCAMNWPAGAALLLQLHLHPSGRPESEQSSVGLYLTDAAPRAQLRPIGLVNAEVDIPPGAKNHVLSAAHVLEHDVDVVGLFPHMHLLGRTLTATATLPDGTVKPVLSIGDWDFAWQSYYQYAEPLRLPAGTRLAASWTFDNSADNPDNPSNPPRRVRFGEQTTDEMGVLILDVIEAGRGDE
jgi:hypothetical protein